MIKKKRKFDMYDENFWIVTEEHKKIVYINSTDSGTNQTLAMSFNHYPELRFAIDNGRTLCVDCHKTTDNFGAKGKIKIANK